MGATVSRARPAAADDLEKTAAPTSTPSFAPTSPTPAARYKAIGVEYVQDGVTKTAYLKAKTLPSMAGSGLDFSKVRGVVLTAGAIMTPKILLNSGVGPRATLMQAGIDVMVDSSNVGQNLQDHPAVAVAVEVGPWVAAAYPSAYDLVNELSHYIDAVAAARGGAPVPAARFGVWSSTGVSAGAFLVSPFSDDGTPDVQLTVYPALIEPHLTDMRERNINNNYDVGNSSSGSSRSRSSSSSSSSSSGGGAAPLLPRDHQMLVAIALMRPEARMQVTLNGSNAATALPRILPATPVPVGAPTSFPASDPVPASINLTDRDVSVLVWGIEEVRKIVAQPPLVEMTRGEVNPGRAVDGPQALAAWVRGNVYPNSHWAGTCAMGGDGGDGPPSVVDASLKVRGVERLRVADASVLPTVPNGNVHATVVAVAHRAAEIIVAEAAGPTAAEILGIK